MERGESGAANSVILWRWLYEHHFYARLTWTKAAPSWQKNADKTAQCNCKGRRGRERGKREGEGEKRDAHNKDATVAACHKFKTFETAELI